jgi:hypothetical protein
MRRTFTLLPFITISFYFKSPESFKYTFTTQQHQTSLTYGNEAHFKFLRLLLPVATAARCLWPL